MYQKQFNTRAHLHTHTLIHTPPHKPVQNVPINENRKQIMSTMLQLKSKNKKRVLEFLLSSHMSTCHPCSQIKGNEGKYTCSLDCKSIPYSRLLSPKDTVAVFFSKASLIKCSCTKSKDVLTNRCLHLFLFRNNT